MSGISQQKAHNLPSTRIMQNCMFLWWPGKNCNSLAGKFWIIHHIHQTLHLWISIYFSLYKILLMEKNSTPWKTAKGSWNSSLLKKIKRFGKMELWSCLKAEGSGTKWWIHCSIKLLVKVKKNVSFIFTLKQSENFVQPINSSRNVSKPSW